MDADDLERLVHDLGFTKVRKVVGSTDTNYMFCCPWHGESNPSAGISAEKEYGACYTCGQGFTVISLVAYMKDLSYRKARDYLEERFNVKKRTTKNKTRIIKRYDEEFDSNEDGGGETDHLPILPTYRLAPYKSGKVCHSYLLDRGFTKDICRVFKLGWDESRCRITIPIFNQRNELLGFLARTVLNKGDKGYRKLYGNTDKYLVDGFQRSRTLFPLNLFEGKDTVILVEGSTDAMWMYQLEFKNVLAVLTSKLSAAQVKLLNRLHVKNIILMFDNDEAGQSGCKKAYDMLKNDFIIYKVTYPKGKNDPANLTKTEIQQMLDEKSFYSSMALKRLE